MLTFQLFAGARRRAVSALVVLFLSCLPAWATPSTTVVISQIYTAGGNSGATYNADYVELFNLSSANVSLNGFAVQYISSTGTSGTVIPLPAGVTLLPGQRYLIQGTPGTVGAPLPSAADYTASGLAAGAAAGRLYLTSSTVALAGTCPSANVVDLVGYGSTAACFEGPKPAPAPSTTLADLRTNPCTDTDNNGADFTTATPSPRNSAAASTPCSTSSTTSLAVSAAVSPSSINNGQTALFTATVTPATGSPTVTVTADLSSIGGSSSSAFHDDGQNGDTSANDNTFSFTEPISSAISMGTYSIVVRASDSALHTASSTVTLTVAPAATLTPIHTIQGSTPGTSAFNGKQVQISGIVTGLKATGFYLQARDSDADSDPNTSEAIYVYTGSGNIPAAAVRGNQLSMTGTVNVYAGSSALFPDVELDNPTGVTLLSTANPLPTAVTLTTSNPSPSGGIYQLYRMQSMRVAVPSLTTTQGSDGTFTETTETYVSNGIFWGIVTGTPRPAREPGLEVLDPLTPTEPATIPRFDDNPETFQVDSLGMTGRPAALDLSSSTLLTNVSGIVDFTGGTQTLLLDADNLPLVTGGTLTSAAPAPASNQVTVGELNMERFYNDIKDTPGAVTITTEAFQRRLKKASLAIRNVFNTPDVLAVEEMENLPTLTSLAQQISADAVAAGKPDPGYMPYLELGTDSSGISVGFLVKPSRINVISAIQFGKTTTYTNSTGAQAVLNDRPPYVLHAGIKRTGGADYPVTIIVNHLRSLNGVTDPTSTGASVRLKREAQAEYLANLIQGYQSAGEHVIVVGDFNAFEFNDGLVDSIGVIKGTPAPANQDVIAGVASLVSPPLQELLPTNVATNTYTYVFKGNAQSITHFLTTGDLSSSVNVMALHLNADFSVTGRNDATTPNRTSDHDGEIGYLTVPALASSLTFSPTSLNFPNVPLGVTSIDLTGLIVTNTGAAPIAFTSIVASTGFTQSNTCGATLAAGATCTLTVSFKPIALGTVTGNITLTDTDTNLTQTIALSGTGVPPPMLTLSAASATFPSTIVGLTSAAQTFTATNTGTSPISLIKVSASAGFTQTNTCGGIIAAAGTCALSVTFAPTAAGPMTGSVIFTDSATPSPQTLTLSGTGIAATPTITLAGSTSTAVAGATVTFTATLAGNSSTSPSGQVQFQDAGKTIGSVGIISMANPYTALVTFPTSALAAGTHTITAVYSGDTLYPSITSSAVMVTVSPAPAADFSITLSNSILSLTHAAPTQSSTVTFTPLNGFNAPVTFTCSGRPAYSTCTVTPASLSANGTTTLTVTAYTATASLAPSPILHTSQIVLALLGLPFLLAGSRQRKLLGILSRSQARTLALLIALATLGILSGCGGSATPQPTPTPTPTTPSGTSTLTLTATSGGITHTAAVTVQVQ